MEIVYENRIYTNIEQLKPRRSMTHLHSIPTGCPMKQQIKQGTPFDPDELSRRLTHHLEEQKARAARRRAARAAKALQLEREAQGVYHHVPAVAASSFQRTATPDALGKVHKLSAPVVKSYLEPRTENGIENAVVGSLLRTQTRDQVLIERDLLRNRNQFQWTAGMDEALTADLERDLYKAPRRTFQHEVSHVRIRHSARAPRPLSSERSSLEEEDVGRGKLKGRSKLKKVALEVASGRHDWAQRDDVVRIKKQPSSIFLWKREATVSNDEREKGIAPIIEGPSTSPISNKGGKSFLARFKRHSGGQ